MNMPDNEADYGDHEADPDDIDDADELTTEALVWQLLLLVNPGDEETALRQFSHYREAVQEAGEEAEPVWAAEGRDRLDFGLLRRLEGQRILHRQRHRTGAALEPGDRLGRRSLG